MSKKGEPRREPEREGTGRFVVVRPGKVDESFKESGPALLFVTSHDAPIWLYDQEGALLLTKGVLKGSN